MSLNGSLDTLIEEVGRMLAEAEAEVYVRQVALDEVKKEAQRLRAILRAAGVAEEKPVVKKATATYTVKPETRTEVLRAIRDRARAGYSALPDVPGSFVVTDITEGFHETTVRNVIKVLREEGVVRVVGKKPVGRARAPLAFALTEEVFPIVS